MNQDEDNCAPAVAFSTVRFFLVTSLPLGWTTVSADWANAFTQATSKEPICMAIPRGFKSKCESNGCLKRSQRTRCFSSKHHHFWSHACCPSRNPDGWLQIVKCGTNEQNADCLTKGLTRFLFESNRKRVQGW